jgi:hypothetical protein
LGVVCCCIQIRRDSFHRALCAFGERSDFINLMYAMGFGRFSDFIDVFISVFVTPCVFNYANSVNGIVSGRVRSKPHSR